MSFSVRVFGYKGLKQLPKNLPRDYSADSVQVNDEPYEWSQKLTVNGSTPVATSANANDAATFIKVEVADDQAVRFEIRPPNRTTDAGDNSPKMAGNDYFAWGAGYTISFVDAASFP